MPKYTIKQGYEHLVFSQEGVRRVSDTQVESDKELNSPYLVIAKDSDQMTAPKPEATQVPPAQPVPTVPQINTEMQNLEEERNKIESTEGAK